MNSDEICWKCRSRIQANGRTFEMNRFQDVEVCSECRRELHEGLGNIQHTKICTYRTEDCEDDVAGGEICPHAGHAEEARRHGEGRESATAVAGPGRGPSDRVPRRRST